MPSSRDPELPSLAELVVAREARIVRLLEVLDEACSRLTPPAAQEIRARERSVFSDLND